MCAEAGNVECYMVMGFIFEVMQYSLLLHMVWQLDYLQCYIAASKNNCYVWVILYRNILQKIMLIVVVYLKGDEIINVFIGSLLLPHVWYILNNFILHAIQARVHEV